MIMPRRSSLIGLHLTPRIHHFACNIALFTKETSMNKQLPRALHWINVVMSRGHHAQTLGWAAAARRSSRSYMRPSQQGSVTASPSTVVTYLPAGHRVSPRHRPPQHPFQTSVCIFPIARAAASNPTNRRRSARGRERGS